MNNEMKKPKFCKDLLGLWYCEPDYEYDKYVYAFSFDKDILNNMIEEHVNDEDKHLYFISRIGVYSLCESDYENKIRHVILPMDDNCCFDTLKYPIYGFNKITGDKCEQVILCSNFFNDRIIDMGISTNPIKIDTFYPESILNA